MRKLGYILIIFAAISCGKNSKDNAVTEAQQDTTQQGNESSSGQQASFDINSITVSNADLGSFPYLSAPEGYEYSDEQKTKRYEEKYFFYNDSLVMTIGGKYFFTKIKPQKGEEFSATYVVKNYEQAIKKLGGVEVFSGSLSGKANEMISQNNPLYTENMYNAYAASYKQFVIRTPKGNVWFELAYGYNVEWVDFTIVSEDEMEETIAIIKADELKNEIDKNGKAVLYINFDTDKATLQPDGIKAVDEIAKLMGSDEALKISIEGHTDNTGSLDHNKKLSLARAEAVVNKLKESGITGNRLKAVGYGADKPLVGNDSDANKAKNRRVEIVKIK